MMGEGVKRESEYQMIWPISQEMVIISQHKFPQNKIKELRFHFISENWNINPFLRVQIVLILNEICLSYVNICPRRDKSWVKEDNQCVWRKHEKVLWVVLIEIINSKIFTAWTKEVECGSGRGGSGARTLAMSG
jgi:hypothetical protein